VTKPRVLIFTETALALSETFIANHCRSLERYEYTLVALYGMTNHHSDVPLTRLNGDVRPGSLRRFAFRAGRDRALSALISRVRPDVMHAHYLPNGVFLRPYAKRHNVPLVVTVHGHDATRRLKWNSVYDQMYRLGRTALIRDAAVVLPVSNFLRDILLEDGFTPSSIENPLSRRADRHGSAPGGGRGTTSHAVCWQAGGEKGHRRRA
jgi:colanic acid/amylovoran biosynthesis glycosyltransferase